jgi:PAS domain S-box-containing protein
LLVRSIDRTQGVEEIIKFSIQDLIQEYPQLVQHDDLYAAQTGVVLINGRPLLAASRPVLTSLYEEPRRGTLIFGTWLNAVEAEHISSLVRCPIVIHPLDEESTKIPVVFRSGSASTLKEYLERYHAVIQQSGDAILLIDSNWHLLHSNPASRQLLDLQENEKEPLNLRMLLSWVGDDTISDLLKACEHGSPVERRCTRKDGQTFFIDIKASAIAYLDSTAYSVTIRDVTLRKEQENALRASEKRYELAVRGANDGLWDWDLMRDEVYYSDRWKEMLGLSYDEINSSPYEWLKRIHPQDRGNLRSQLRMHCEEHTPLFSSEH